MYVNVYVWVCKNVLKQVINKNFVCMRMYVGKIGIVRHIHFIGESNIEHVSEVGFVHVHVLLHFLNLVLQLRAFLLL